MGYMTAKEWNAKLSDYTRKRIDRLIKRAEEHKKVRRDFDVCDLITKYRRSKHVQHVPEHTHNVTEYDTVNANGTAIHVEIRH